MKIAQFAFNAFQENTYVLSDETGECIIVDPGNATMRENEILTRYIDDNGLKPVMIVNTHAHVDHLAGVSFLKDSYHIPFALHGEDEFLVRSAPVQGRLYGFELEGAVPTVVIDLSRQNTVRFGNTELEIFHTPGHSPGHISLYDKKDKVLLTGDVLFRGSIGRTDLPGGDYHRLMRSIIGTLIPLGREVKVFSGHGPSTTIGHELESNPFITEVIEGEVNF